MIKIAVIGLGNRGTGYMAYVKHMLSKQAKIVAICDIYKKRVLECQKTYNIPDEMCFDNEEAFWNKGKLADAIFICTQDQDHYRHVMKAVDLGYHILCEKPLSPSLKECEEMERAVSDKGVKMLVCHVLRYSKYYQKIKELIDSGVIGDLKAIDHTENIGYYHFAHSYVRGNWRDSNTTSPMIMAKTCHDLDLIHWFMDGGCERVSSFGGLSYFNKENMPKGATPRCLDGCKVKDKCPYDAERLYITSSLLKATFLKFRGRTLTGIAKPSKADKYKALREGLYGRCVFLSDNNVSDHQHVNMEFSGGRIATLTATAFSKRCYRHTHIMGTLGEIRGDDRTGWLRVKLYHGKNYKVSTKPIPLPIGHLGGDYGLVMDFVAMLTGKPTKQTDLTLVDVTLHSHRMALAAEYSKNNKGVVVELDKFKG